MPRIADLQITRRTPDGKIVEYYQIKPACIRVDYDITGKTFEILEVTAAETILFSSDEGSSKVAYIMREGEHLFADMTRKQTDALQNNGEMLA